MPSRERVQAFVGWRFDMTSHEGLTRRLDELSLQTWRGDRIASERFFYDPASIVPVAAG